MSRMFGQSSVLHKHHWSLNPSLPPCQGQPTVLAQTKYMDVCVLDSQPMYINITSESDSRACLSVSVHDYVWLCVSTCIYYSDQWDFDLYVLVFPRICGYVSAYVYLCVCVYMMEEEKGGVWKSSLAQSCCSLNLCGCQRKLWSEESANRAWGMSPETRIIWNPETTAGRHLCGPLLKGRQRPWVRATLPPRSSHLLGLFRSRAQLHHGTSSHVRCAINACSNVWAHLTAVSPGRAIMRSRRPGETLVCYISSHSRYRFTVMCAQVHRSTSDPPLYLHT